MVIGYGKTTRVYKTLKPTRRMCRGCRDDFYNGQNPYNIKECWNFKDAQVVDAEYYLSVHSVNPTKIKKVMSCFKG